MTSAKNLPPSVPVWVHQSDWFNRIQNPLHVYKDGGGVGSAHRQAYVQLREHIKIHECNKPSHFTEKFHILALITFTKSKFTEYKQKKSGALWFRVWSLHRENLVSSLCHPHTVYTTIMSNTVGTVVHKPLISKLKTCQQLFTEGLQMHQ